MNTGAARVYRFRVAEPKAAEVRELFEPWRSLRHLERRLQTIEEHAIGTAGSSEPLPPTIEPATPWIAWFRRFAHRLLAVETVASRGVHSSITAAPIAELMTAFAAPDVGPVGPAKRLGTLGNPHRQHGGR